MQTTEIKVTNSVFSATMAFISVQQWPAKASNSRTASMETIARNHLMAIPNTDY